MPQFVLDAIDRRIVARLQTDGRISNQDLADAAGLSPSPCLRRVRALEEAGVIAGYVALVSPQAVGLNVTAFVRIRLRDQSDRNLTEFEQVVGTFPEVLECYLMSGDCDYQLRVMVASLTEFEDFLRLKLTKISAVSQVTTSFALRPTVYRTQLPL